MLRSNLLFIHVVSAMGIFVALGMEALALAQLRRAADGVTARTTLAALGISQRVGGPSMLLLLLSGLYLATAYWRWEGGWIGVGFLGLVSIGAIGGLMTGRRISRLRKDVQNAGTYSSLVEAGPTLWTSFVLRAALLIGVVFLMTVKPGPVGSLASLGTALLAGILASATARESVTVESVARR
jgi:hypothetical protein